MFKWLRLSAKTNVRRLADWLSRESVWQALLAYHMTDYWTTARHWLRWRQRSIFRRLFGPGVEPREWQALSAYRGLVHQAYSLRPLAPRVSADMWVKGEFIDSSDTKPFYSPFKRERENSSHHYGHDIVIKRHAGLSLVGPPFSYLLEHGLKVAQESLFEKPQPWTTGYLCMGPLRARWLQERFGVPAIAIGPWISYARPLLAEHEITALRSEMGSTLLVVLAHSWDLVERSMDFSACIREVAKCAERNGYQQVIWLRHWKDPEIKEMPPDWIVACNGHRSNPWFLDSMRTLLELSDGLASNAFGTHLGYATALDRRLHWIDVPAEENLMRLHESQAAVESIEWRKRQQLSDDLSRLLAEQDEKQLPTQAPVFELMDPYWGFDEVKSAAQMHAILNNRYRES